MVVAQVSAFVTGGTENRDQSERPLFPVLSPENIANENPGMLK
jgi:hypothetical protein